MHLRARNILAPFLVFVMAWGVAFLMQTRVPELASPDDPYYHAYISETMLSGKTPSMPIYSVLAREPVDFYLGYHILGALFIAPFETVPGDHTRIILGAKLYHGFLVGLFALTLFLVTRSLIRKTKYPKAATLAGIAATLLPFAYSYLFLYRTLLERPHAISMLAVLVGFYAVASRKYILLASAAFVLPFFYSTSFFILMPPMLFALSETLYEKRISLRSLIPFWYGAGGLALGILARPDTLGYVAYGWFLNMQSLVNNYVVGSGPGELYPSSFGIGQYEFWIFLATIAFFAFFVMKKKKMIDRALFFWGSSAFILVTGSLFISRFLEYSIPVFAVFAILLCIRLLEESPEVRATLSKVPRAPKILVAGMALLCIANMCMVVIYYKVHSSDRDGKYEMAANFLTAHSKPGDIVHLSDFGQYANMVFFNDSNRYTIGNDPAFTQYEHLDLYFLYTHIGDRKLCPRQDCSTGTTLSYYEALHDAFRAKYILTSPGNIEKVLPILLEDPAHFRLVFTDPKFSGINLFEIAR